MEDWIHLNKTTGQGNATVDVSLDENTGPERSASLTIKTDGGSQDSVEIRQAACACNHQLLKDVLTYRTTWKDWTLYSLVDAEISADGLVLKIKRFSPNETFMVSNIENPSNTTLCAAFSNWKVRIEGINRIYEEGIIIPYSHTTWGGPKYIANGISFTPKAYGKAAYLQNYPWDLGVSGGKLKDPNRGANNYGYTNDGVKNVFNIDSFPVRSTMGTEYQMGIIISTQVSGNLRNVFSSVKESAKINSNYRITVTKRHEGSYDPNDNSACCTSASDFAPLQIRVTGLQEGDILQWVGSDGITYEDRNITEDGVYTFSRVSGGAEWQGLYLQGNPEITSEVKIAVYDDGKLDEDGMVDISDNPVVLTILPTNTSVPLWRQECWEYVDSKGQTYQKAKTVENCLMKYYNGSHYSNPDYNIYGGISLESENLGVLDVIHIDAADISLEGYDTMEDVVAEFPDLSEIIDLGSYNMQTLKVRARGTAEGNRWADWLNGRAASYYLAKDISEEGSSPMLLWRILSGWMLSNDDSHQIVLDIDLSQLTDEETHEFLSFDHLMYDYYQILSGSNLDARVNLKLRITGGEGAGTYLISTLKRAFWGFLGKLEIEYPDGNGIRYIAPTTMDATFCWTSLEEVDLSQIDLSHRLSNMNYAFENAFSKRIVSDDTVKITKYNSINQGTGYNAHSWPVGLGQDSGSRPTFIQVFNGCGHLTEIGMVMDVSQVPDPASASSAFSGCSSLVTMRLKGINNFDWDFTQLTSLSQESIQYIIDNAEDQVGTPYDAQYARADNVPSSTTDGALYDYVHIRSSRSADGLKILAPEEWRSKLTTDMVQAANAKGWHIYIGDDEITA